MNSRAQPADARRYDFVVCGAGSSGSVVARRLSDDPAVRVMLVEAGGSDDDPAVHAPQLWPTNLGSERDWAFRGEPDPGLDGRSILFSMGKVLGGGSSINVMVWARGHQKDWDAMASIARDASWGYASVLDIYRKRIEDWHGAPDIERRGSAGPAHVAPPQNPHPLPIAIVDAAAECGLPTFDSPNGKMMESPAGAALSDLRVRDGKRESVFRSYLGSVADRPNLTVVTRADVLAVTFDGKSRRWAVGSAVAAAVAVVAISAFLVVGRGDGGTPPQRVALEPVAAGTGAGEVTMRADGGSTAMTVSTSGLRRPQHGYYEVWLLDPATNKMLPVGVLPPSGGSTYDLPASVIGRYSAVDVSLEPDDGNPAHSTDSVLRGTYRA